MTSSMIKNERTDILISQLRRTAETAWEELNCEVILKLIEVHADFRKERPLLSQLSCLPEAFCCASQRAFILQPPTAPTNVRSAGLRGRKGTSLLAATQPYNQLKPTYILMTACCSRRINSKGSTFLPEVNCCHRNARRSVLIAELGTHSPEGQNDLQ